VERSLLSFFGFPAYGVHCNAWSKKNNSTFIHIAKRSKKIKKFPGLLDNLVAGGQPSNISIIDNLKKEGFEEAGLIKSCFKNLKKGSTIHYCHNEEKKINSAIIFVYNLEINKDFVFKNMDGEVESFFYIEINEIYKILENKQLKPNCIIPLADFFVRKLKNEFSKNGINEIERILKTYE